MKPLWNEQQDTVATAQETPRWAYEVNGNLKTWGRSGGLNWNEHVSKPKDPTKHLVQLHYCQEATKTKSEVDVQMNETRVEKLNKPLQIILLRWHKGLCRYTNNEEV